MQQQETQESGIQFDIMALLRALLHRIWAILICVVLCGSLLFGYVYFRVTPTYQAKVLLYVNSSLSTGNVKLSVSGSDISTARSIISTYVVILMTRTTLDAVAEESGLDYSYEQLSGMISASAVSNTEILQVTVTCTNPSEAQLLANTIASVLPKKIGNIVDGTSARVVDYAVLPTSKSGPDLKKYLIIGMAIGLVLSAGIIILRELMDDQIHDEEYLIQKYSTIPVIGIIPDIDVDSKKKYGYYKHQYYKNGYQYRNDYRPMNTNQGKGGKA